MLRVFADTDCDITPEMAKDYGFELISMPYIVEGKEIYPYVDWKKFEADKFYEELRTGDIPSTCGLSPETYRGYFEPVFKKGDDILYIHFSRVMTSSFEAMDIAVKDLKERYPERTFAEIDCRGITIGATNLVLEVGDLYKQGKDLATILKFAYSEVQKFAVYFYADNLKFFAKSGRVSGISAKMGNLFGVHPIIYMDSEGKMDSLTKVRGRLQGLKKLISYMEELGEDMEQHRVIIAHTGNLELAKRLASLIEERFGKGLRIVFTEVNPTAGSHCGPDCVGVSFHARHR